MEESQQIVDVYLSHRARFVEVAAAIVGCRARAEDIVQDAFLKVTTAQRQGIAIQHPLPYLLQAIRRLAIDRLRFGRVRNEEDICNSAIQGLLADPLSPESHAESREALAIVERALATLPARTRLAFEMKRLGGCKLREIAETLDISIVRAAQLINDAMAACQQALDDTAAGN
ncbi:DNA-directed RNA polymerase sigma-70 factor [Gluconacetobacter liquefaciens]|uniref:Sigma-70 family RNA polymerase sigma factor n=1 Tax=Gluconacetobacter liquefaciens TaxID=89584 RepID=A0A7W4PCE9_GLULI|nr:sigma-70 family RNA polymerase sigma factor [Gluconacetobacter liquefaciens]MBB2187214.1 sigma-70 family RNA polymerase sigma factor [Gluconacetobacter liquefaciens]GBQ99344.1 ECF family RNA polymerase sigma factor [Gluconacetobacter liquefaciens NRIC 0522]GEB38442.1 DNA-directed RNA polymerase sigma-70 factor [Gluconacetobacter liquefaciens]